MTHFVYNPACEAIIRFTPLLEPGLKPMMEDKLILAKSIAPVLTGQYQASLDQNVDFGGPSGQIRGVLFTSDVLHKVLALEFGTHDTPTFATLRRALYGGAGG